MAKESFIKAQGEQLFNKRGSLMYYFQELATNFYPERADFTVDRTLGADFAGGLTSSFPLMVRRDLGNAFSGMLRPTNKAWFHVRVHEWDNVGTEARRWLERAEERMRRAMYHKNTMFVKAMKQGDHDFATFGQCVVQISLDSEATGLLYRCWHLRDVAWLEDTNGKVGTVYRKWKPNAIDLKRLFKNVHPKVMEKANKTPYEPVNVYHLIVPSDTFGEYSEGFGGNPFVGIYFDLDNNHIMEEVGLNRQEYMVPRWQTVSGSQYAYSPASVVALADARTLQSMTLTLLEAGEKSVSPPLLGVKGALRSDVNIMASGITWVDQEYDSRLGEVLRPLTIDKTGLPNGFQMAGELEQKLIAAFFLNKLGLPPSGQEMTAFETSKRVEEYIRNALPLFEPMEAESNTPVCENTFEIMMAHGVFGSPYDMPEELRGREIVFTFESPLHDAIEREKGQRFLEAQGLVANASALDPSAAYILDVKVGVRDVLKSTGTPAIWMRSDKEVEAKTQEVEQAQQTAMLLQQMQQGADVAKTIGDTQAPSGTGVRQGV